MAQMNTDRIDTLRDELAGMVDTFGPIGAVAVVAIFLLVGAVLVFGIGLMLVGLWALHPAILIAFGCIVWGAYLLVSWATRTDRLP